MKPFIFLLMTFSFSVSAASDTPAEYDDDEYTEEDELPFVEIQYAKDFSLLAREARISNKIILLEVSASYCDYCELLEEEFIKPMLRSGDYTDNVLIRKLDTDSYFSITDFNGEKTTAETFARNRNVRLTPTLLFFDGNGNEVSKRILGINSLDLYGGYIDEAIYTGLQKLNAQ